MTRYMLKIANKKYINCKNLTYSKIRLTYPRQSVLNLKNCTLFKIHFLHCLESFPWLKNKFQAHLSKFKMFYLSTFCLSKTLSSSSPFLSTFLAAFFKCQQTNRPLFSPCCTFFASLGRICWSLIGARVWGLYEKRDAHV